MGFSIPGIFVASTAVGAGLGIFVQHSLEVIPNIHLGPAPTIAGLAFGALIGGLAEALVRADRSPLPGVYRDLTKTQFRVIRSYESSRSCLVIQACRRHDDQRVVLKLPNPRSLPHFISSRSDDIRYEYNVVSKIRSPHVMAALDHVEGKGYFIAIFEHIPGPTLEEVLKSDGLLSLSRAVEVFTALARGLHDTHAAGYSYNDLKPANVILNPERRAVLVDFQYASAPLYFQGTLSQWVQLFYRAISERDDAFRTGMSIRDVLASRNITAPEELTAADGLQRIIDRATRKPGVDQYQDFETLIDDLGKWHSAMGHIT